MVFRERLHRGFHGFEVPHAPRSTRSARKRGIGWRRGEESQMCAFDLLATVAGKILREDEISPISDTHTLEENNVEQSFFLSELVSQEHILNNHRDSVSPISVITTSDSSDKFAHVEQQLAFKDSSSCKLDIGVGKPRKHEALKNGKKLAENKAGMCSLDLIHPDRKSSSFVCSDNIVKLTLSTEHMSRDNGQHQQQPSKVPRQVGPGMSTDCVELGNNDDDENSFWCVGGQRLAKKSMASPHPSADVETAKHDSSSDNNSVLNSGRSLRDYPFKKRKLYACSDASNSDRGKTNDGIYSSNSNDGIEDQTVHEPSNSAARGRPSFRSGDSRVKLGIKSFRVPELFIEIPETSTIGSLKRSVVEAVSAILRGRLRVGVLFQGKKVRDDSKTLLQTGICHDSKPDSLAFSLEPVPSQEHPYLLPRDAPQPLRRYSPARNVADNAPQQRSVNASSGTHLINFMESDRDSAPSPLSTSSLDKHASDSRALAPVNVVDPTRAIVPARKPKRSEAAQRRIRRPFSVSEVESLVQAVEKLGTGRWRDVKLRAFDNAKHRTYVDLKDKWKTLVHTARISPQQRRGEPVPQELLDRVLIAHAYWSHQQAKHQMMKQKEAETCLLL
ncbi:unnamed protein product [Cuscuta campestris]|uniref:Uncharacterized protein n=1 Tax=Cuscuta campestris TaxID=132261 RepID=A0A484NCG3_9ASTE|nr:unnamed protein product [Cuscuta campestris]